MSKKDSEDVPQTPSTDTVPEGSFNEVDGTAENLTKLSEAEHGQEATTPLIQTTLVSRKNTQNTHIHRVALAPFIACRNGKPINVLPSLPPCFAPAFTCSPKHAAPTQRQPPTRTTPVCPAVAQRLRIWESSPLATHPLRWPLSGRAVAMGSAMCWASTSVPCITLCCVAIWPSCPNPCSTNIR